MRNTRDFRGRWGAILMIPLATSLLSSPASAGTYTADLVEWLPSYSGTGNYTASISGRTVDWTCNDDHRSTLTDGYGNSSSVSGNVRWKVTWHPSFAGERPPKSTPTILVAQYGGVSVTASIWDPKSSPHNGFHADASAQNYSFGSALNVHVDLAANTMGVPSQQAGTGDQHQGYTPYTCQLAKEESGNIVGYLPASIMAQTSINTSSDTQTGLIYAFAEASVHGTMRLVMIGTQQVADDFAGGSYATSGYGN